MKSINDKKNKVVTDFKATVVAADRIQNGQDSNTIEIIPLGGNRRAFAKEIENIEEQIAETSGNKYTRITINKEGLYDMLPEGLFHTLATGTDILDEDIMIEDIQIKRQEEKDARTFFAPFEIEIFHIKTLLELYENRLDMQTSYSEMGNLLAHSWNELKFLNNKQRVIWMHFIPEIQSRKNDLNYCQKLLSLLLNIPITISKKNLELETTSNHSDFEASFSLGNIDLGINSVTKNSIKTSSQVIEIKIGPTSQQLIKDYLPNQHKEKIIKMTLDYLLPVDAEVVITYDLLPENKYSKLFDNPNESTTVLGHTSYL